MYEYVINKGDTIWNPLVYWVLQDNWEMEPKYSVSKLGLWSLNRDEEVSEDNSLRLYTWRRKWAISDILSHKKMYRWYSVPITLEEILAKEYAIPVDLDYYDFEDDVLEQIKASSFGASQIYEMTGKKDGNSFMIARNEGFWWVKPEADTSKEEDLGTFWLPA